MSKLSKRFVLLILSVGLFLTSLGGAVASAQTSTGAAGNGIRISPVRSDLTINPGETRTLTLTVQNITSGDAEFQAIINDFIAGENEDGQPALILDASKYAPSHSLKRYISSIPNLTIPAGESKQVGVVISIPKGAAGGGYYGAVRFTPVGESSKGVTLSASVGTLILVKVPGDIKENVTLESFDVRKGTDATGGSSFFVSNKNLYAVARFQNSGNVHEQPFGKVVVKRGDKIVQSTEINNTDPRGNVLPDSVRRFNVKLDKVGQWGRYTVSGNFGYGSSGQLLSGDTSFIVVPLALIIGVIVIIALIVALVFGLPRAIKRYNQRVISRASRRR